MSTGFRFEGPTIESLEHMPLDLRRKLDLAGVHLSLDTWQALPLDARRALCDAPAHDDAGVAAFREEVVARAGSVGHAVSPATAVAPAWRAEAPPDLVVARTEMLALDVDLARWASLDEAQRYALFRLADPRKQPDKFRDALEEFRLLRATGT